MPPAGVSASQEASSPQGRRHNKLLNKSLGVAKAGKVVDTIMVESEAKSEPSDTVMKDQEELPEEASPAAGDDTPATGSGDEASAMKDDPPGPTNEERVSTAEACKEAGNTLLKSGDYEGAVVKYTEGVGSVEPLLEKVASDMDEGLHLRRSVVYVALCLNSAQACIKQSKWADASEHATRVLAIEAQNTKALYRRGVASMELASESRLEQARTDLAQFVQLEPSNREARDRLQQVKDQLKEVRQREKEKFAAGMKGGLYKENHKQHDRQKLEYEEEVKRRAAADPAEDEITWEDWQKKLKDKAEDAKKKEKEDREKRSKDLAAEEEQRQLAEENERRAARGEGLEPMTLEEWRAERQKSSPKKEEVVRMDTDDLDEEEKKMLEEQKAKGYYHGRLGTVLSNAAPKPQQLSEGDLRREPSPEVGENGRDVNKGSEWNQAGTWEERDTTAWVKERLTSWLSMASVSSRNVALPSGEVTVSAKVTQVKSLSGEAQVVTVRQKPRFGYNFEAELSFRIKVEQQQADEKMPAASDGDQESPEKDKKSTTERFDGTLSMAELADFMQPEELRPEARWKSRSPPTHLQPTVLESLEALKESVRTQVRGFLREYHAH